MICCGLQNAGQGKGMRQVSRISSAEPQSIVSVWYATLHERRPLIVVISGPSGVGKDATIQRMKDRGYPCHFVVTATTRARRPNEIDGVDYHFISEDYFADLLRRGEL